MRVWGNEARNPRASPSPAWGISHCQAQAGTRAVSAHPCLSLAPCKARPTVALLGRWEAEARHTVVSGSRPADLPPQPWRCPLPGCGGPKQQRLVSPKSAPGRLGTLHTLPPPFPKRDVLFQPLLLMRKGSPWEGEGAAWGHTAPQCQHPGVSLLITHAKDARRWGRCCRDSRLPEHLQTCDAQSHPDGQLTLEHRPHCRTEQNFRGCSISGTLEPGSRPCRHLPLPWASGPVLGARACGGKQG